MELTYTGELVRVRPFRDKDEFTQMIDRLSMQEHRHWPPGWWPLGQRTSLYDKAGLVGNESFWSYFAVDRLDTDELAGYEVLQIPKPGQIRVEIGTVLFEEHWHRGFGREAKLLMMTMAFENYPVLAVCAGTIQTHSRARAGLMAMGMEYEGMVKRAAFTMSKHAGIAIYSIFREDWEKMAVRGIVKRS